ELARNGAAVWSHYSAFDSEPFTRLRNQLIDGLRLRRPRPKISRFRQSRKSDLRKRCRIERRDNRIVLPDHERKAVPFETNVRRAQSQNAESASVVDRRVSAEEVELQIARQSPVFDGRRSEGDSERRLSYRRAEVRAVV